MTRTRCFAALVLTASVAAGCGPKGPVLYPNAHAREVGEEQQRRDIAECRALADEHASSASTSDAAAAARRTATGSAVGAAGGAAGGAVYGHAGRGAASGAAGGAAAGLMSWLLRPRQPPAGYVGIVNRCLQERGYQVAGWQ